MSDDLPKGSPHYVKILYVAIGSAAALAAVVTVGLNAIPPFKEAALNGGRALHIVSPQPVKDIGPLATGWLPSGSTWASASQAYIDRAKAANPDYIVTFHQDREYETDDPPFHRNARYRYEGSVTYEPRWKGIV